MARISVIGSAPSNYTTLQAWEDSMAATLTDAEIGQCKNENISSSTTLLTFSGVTTSVTNSITLTTASGASFIDNINVETNALFPNPANGATITATNGYTAIFSVDNVSNIYIEKLQLIGTGTPVTIFGLSNTPTNHHISNCLIRFNARANTNDQAVQLWQNSSIKNCLIVKSNTGTGKCINLGAECSVYNCTIIGSGDIGTAIRSSYGTSNIVRNSIIVGFEESIGPGGPSAITLYHNGTDFNATNRPLMGSGLFPPSGAHTICNINPDDHFVDKYGDFRLKSTSSLIDRGASTAPLGYTTDVLNRTRVKPDIGCWEDSAVASDPPLPTRTDFLTGSYQLYGSQQPCYAIHSASGVTLTKTVDSSLLTNLVSAWELNEISGSGIDSHSTNHLSENGGSLSSTSSGVFGETVRVKSQANSFSFRRVDNTSLSVGAGTSFEAAIWVRQDVLTQSNIQIFGKAAVQSASLLEWGIHTASANSLPILRVSDGVTLTSLTSSYATENGAWNLIHAWYDHSNSLLGIKLNNTPSKTQAYASGVWDAAQPLCIGNSDQAFSEWNGCVSKARFWKGRVLTEQERLLNWNGGLGLTYAQMSSGSLSIKTDLMTGSWQQYASIVASPVTVVAGSGGGPAGTTHLGTLTSVGSGTLSSLSSLLLNPLYSNNSAGGISFYGNLDLAATMSGQATGTGAGGGSLNIGGLYTNEGSGTTNLTTALNIAGLFSIDGIGTSSQVSSLILNPQYNAVGSGSSDYTSNITFSAILAGSGSLSTGGSLISSNSLSLEGVGGLTSMPSVRHGVTLGATGAGQTAFVSSMTLAALYGAAATSAAGYTGGLELAAALLTSASGVSSTLSSITFNQLLDMQGTGSTSFGHTAILNPTFVTTGLGGISSVPSLNILGSFALTADGLLAASGDAYHYFYDYIYLNVDINSTVRSTVEIERGSDVIVEGGRVMSFNLEIERDTEVSLETDRTMTFNVDF